jgi:hypothetical protein
MSEKNQSDRKKDRSEGQVEHNTDLVLRAQKHGAGPSWEVAVAWTPPVSLTGLVSKLEWRMLLALQGGEMFEAIVVMINKSTSGRNP